MLSVDHVAHFLPSSPEPVITAMVSGGTPTVGRATPSPALSLELPYSTP